MVNEVFITLYIFIDCRYYIDVIIQIFQKEVNSSIFYYIKYNYNKNLLYLEYINILNIFILVLYSSKFYIIIKVIYNTH